MTGISKSICTVTETVDNDCKGFQKIIMTFMNLNKQFSIKKYDKLMQSMFEIQPFCRFLYYWTSASSVSCICFYEDIIRIMKLPLDLKQKYVVSSNGLSKMLYTRGPLETGKKRISEHKTFQNFMNAI